MLALLAAPAYGGEPAPGQRLSVADRVSVNGVGAVRIGMALADLERAIGLPLRMDPEVEGECTQATPAEGASGISFLIVADVVARIDVTAPGFKTRPGAEVGDSEERVQKLYGGQLKVTPHHYADGHYLTLRAPDGTWALVFETIRGHVSAYRAGRLPEALYTEGCS